MVHEWRQILLTTRDTCNCNRYSSLPRFQDKTSPSVYSIPLTQNNNPLYVYPLTKTLCVGVNVFKKYPIKQLHMIFSHFLVLCMEPDINRIEHHHHFDLQWHWASRGNILACSVIICMDTCQQNHIVILPQKEHYLGLSVGNDNWWRTHGIGCEERTGSGAGDSNTAECTLSYAVSTSYTLCRGTTISLCFCTLI